MNREKSIIITKVKIAKGKIKINYDKSREGFSESFYMESGEKAAPEFYDAFQTLSAHVAAIMCFIGDVMKDRIVPNEVTFSYDDLGFMTAKIGFNLYIQVTDEYVSISTPARKEALKATDDNDPKFLADSTLNALQDVIDEAEKYIDGERAQGDLFKDAG